MDLRSLQSSYKRLGRKPAVQPITLLKVLLYAAMEGIYSSRDIASACVRDINFIWLLNGEKTPNHYQIARFRSQRLSLCGEALFYQLVKRLGNKGEIMYDHLFVDGTKIEENANKYSFVWKKSTNKYEARLLTKLEEVHAALCQQYGVLAPDAEALLSVLESRMTAAFVYGRGKRKTQLQRDIETLRVLLNRKAKYAGYQATFQGRNSFSKTDPDTTFMHMKEDHMRNAQLKPGCNVQFGVEGEYITGVSLSSERSDHLALIPLLDSIETQLGRQYKDITADAGYESEENYTYLEGKQTQCYIKPQNYERSKTRKFKNNMALRENMAYDALLDVYTCQQGRKLNAIYEGIRKSKSGFESLVTYYECEDCSGCPRKKQYTRSKGNRKLQVSKRFIARRCNQVRENQRRVYCFRSSSMHRHLDRRSCITRVDTI